MTEKCVEKTPEKAFPRTLIVLPSAGKGVRMGSRKKVFLPLLDRPVLAHTLKAFEDSPLVSSIIVAVPADLIDLCEDGVVRRFGFKKVAAVIAGGLTRQESVLLAIKAGGDAFDLIAVHDGARPLVSEKVIEETLREAARTGAAVPVVRLKDTVKEVREGFIKGTVDRETLRGVQTPQCFRAALLLEAHEKATRDGFTGTDEASLVERLGVNVAAVEGSYENLKITTKEDLLIAGSILRKRLEN